MARNQAGVINMKKLLLLSLLFLLSVNSYAGAICNDGWISKSSGSGTCSSHGGVKKWLNKKESSDKYEDIYSPDNGVVGKCKGTYQQRKKCGIQRALIMKSEWYKIITQPNYISKREKEKEMQLKEFNELINSVTPYEF